MSVVDTEHQTVWQLIASRAADTPDRSAIMCADGHRETFGELAARSERLAAGLFELGIGPGTRVSWQLPTIADTFAVMFALARLGAVQNPLVPVYRSREVASALAQFDAEWLITIASWRGFDHGSMARELTAERSTKVLIIDDGLPTGDPVELPAPPSDPEAVRWIYTTSGTTADPKCARHCDRSLIAAGRGWRWINGVMDDDVGSMPYPVAHIGGPMQTMGAQLVGIPIVPLDPFVPADAVETMRRFGVTQTGGGTAHYLAMIAEQRKHPDGPIVPTLRRMSGGGGAKPPEVFFELLDTLGIRCHHGYGMTECPYLASTSVHDTDEQLAYTDGLPLPGSEIRLVDTDGNDVPTGEIGEVWVRSPLLCRGYLDEEMTADAFTADGFFRTGDLARFRDDGRIRVTGRIKDIIIRKGENISALDVELVVRQLPGVADVAVIGVPDSDRGERVCAVIELHEGATAPTLDDVRRHCVAMGLMMQKVPEQLEVIDALPRNAFLKVVKPLLRQRFNS